MTTLNNLEMDNIWGGNTYVVVGAIVAIMVVFITGIIEGIANPRRCD